MVALRAVSGTAPLLLPEVTITSSPAFPLSFQHLWLCVEIWHPASVGPPGRKESPAAASLSPAQKKSLSGDFSEQAGT